jgi:cytochrome P450
LTDGQICDNILLMLFAGHDTSSSTLTHCLNNLQDHPAAMQQLRAEQAAVVAKHGQLLTAAALKDMRYAEAVIR